MFWGRSPSARLGQKGEAGDALAKVWLFVCSSFGLAMGNFGPFFGVVESLALVGFWSVTGFAAVDALGDFETDCAGEQWIYHHFGSDVVFSATVATFALDTLEMGGLSCAVAFQA